MKTVEISGQETTLQEVVKLARESDGLVLTEKDQPVAKVVPLNSGAENLRAPRKLGLHRGVWQISNDFDAALSDEFWLGQE